MSHLAHLLGHGVPWPFVAALAAICTSSGYLLGAGVMRQALISELDLLWKRNEELRRLLHGQAYLEAQNVKRA